MMAANVLQPTIFARWLHHFFKLQETGGCMVVMHTETRSVKCTFVGAKEEVDVFSVSGPCGTKRCIRGGGGSAKLETIQRWPTLALKSRAQFKSCVARRKALKIGKGKRAVELAPNPNQILPPLALYLHLRGRIVRPHFRAPMHLLRNN